MSSLSFFDPIKVALDFLAIQADNMSGKRLEIGFLHSKEKLLIAKLIVDKKALKAFYAQSENEPLQEFSPSKLLDVGGVRII